MAAIGMTRGQGGGWAVVVHGGAKEVLAAEEEANRRGCLDAVAAALASLESGGDALDAAEQAVRVLEQDPMFNAGFGSSVTVEGRVEMDAAIMDGSTFDIGAVAAIEAVRHPVSVARLLLRETPILLAGAGARRFACTAGAELCPPDAMIAPKRRTVEFQQSHDTVGCVVLDRGGKIAAAISTGGFGGKLAGRVGDSPLPGCGFFADSQVGGVAMSGEGESIARVLMAGRVIQELEAGVAPKEALARSIHRLGKIGGEAGGIAVDRHGNIGYAHNSAHFPIAWMAAGMDRPEAALKQSEKS